MKIVVRVEQVPKPSHVREGVPLELNEFDVYDITEAIRLREAHRGEVSRLTMGPPQAEDALRMTLAMGADRAGHLNDKVFAVADTIDTSRTLAIALKQEGADLVLCGRKRVDFEVRGAFEHVVGSVRAGVIVALNANEPAPIFRHVDVGLVGDRRETLPPPVDVLEGKLP